jgi:lysozyme family protein
MANFDIAVAKVLKREGGDKITNDPNDNGGLTKYGISERSYPDLDIAKLTEGQAKDIYLDDFWLPIMGHAINSQVIAESIFDFAVNAGVKTSSRLAQEACGNTKPDGVIGNKTVELLNSTANGYFIRNLALAKIRHYTGICRRDPTQKKFYFGWIDRALEGL